MRVAQGTYDGTPESAAVVERFDLPDNLPEPVAVAKANFDRCVEHLREAKQARSQAQEELVAAARADVETEAQALVTGAAPPKKKAEENARAAAEDASRAEAVAVSAVDQAGDALLEAIEEARPEWLGQLDQEAAAAHSPVHRGAVRSGGRPGRAQLGARPPPLARRVRHRSRPDRRYRRGGEPPLPPRPPQAGSRGVHRPRNPGCSRPRHPADGARMKDAARR